MPAAAPTPCLSCRPIASARFDRCGATVARQPADLVAGRSLLRRTVVGRAPTRCWYRRRACCAFSLGRVASQRHCERARQLGIALHVQPRPRLGLDVDLPSDIDDLEAHLAMETTDVEEKNVVLDDRGAAFLAQPGC